MHAALRPYVTTGVAIVGASVLVVSPLTVPTHDVPLAHSSAAVEMAAATTDTSPSVADIATIFAAVQTSRENIAAFQAAAPQLLFNVVLASVQHPGSIPGYQSYLARTLLEMPTPTNLDVHSALADATMPVVNALDQVLPAPYGTTDATEVGSIITAAFTIGALINQYLETFGTPIDPTVAPQPASRVRQATADSITDAAKLLVGIRTVLDAVQTSQDNIAAFQDAAPALTFSIVLAAALNPTSIPGLQSYVAHTLLEMPTAANLDVHSLLADAAMPIVSALAEVLPAPYGPSPTDPSEIGTINTTAFTIGARINEYLEIYGEPVDPSTVTGGIFGAQPAAAAPAATTPDISLSDEDIATIWAAVQTSRENVDAFQEAAPALIAKLAWAAFWNPTSILGLTSYLAHTLAEAPTPTNPDVHSLLADAAMPIVNALSSVLPSPYGPSPTDPADIGTVKTTAFAVGALINEYLDENFAAPVDPDTLTGGVFGGLFGAGAAATAPEPPTDLPDDVATIVSAAIAESQANTAAFQANLPHEIDGLVKAVLAKPTLLPNAVSSLTWSLVGYPESDDAELSLLAGAVRPLVTAADKALPGPLGSDGAGTGEVATTAATVGKAINTSLAALPPKLEDLSEAPTPVRPAAPSTGVHRQALKQAVPATFAKDVTDTSVGKAGPKLSAKVGSAAGATKGAKAPTGAPKAKAGPKR